MLKGRLRGYAVGLVQLFRDVPCPDLLARELLGRLLEEFRETAHHYLLELVHAREKALYDGGTAEEVTALDTQIYEHAIHQQIPQRWQLDDLFSQAGYDEYGDDIFAFWAGVLLHINTLEQHWEGALLGLRPRNPCLRFGFHPDEKVLDTSWLVEFRQTWASTVSTELVEDEAEGPELRAIPPEEGESDVSDPGQWVN